MNLLQWKFLHPRFWPSWLGLGLLRVSIYLPVKMQLWLGARLGGLLGILLKKRTHIARRNLEICFPELTTQQRENLLVENQKNLGILVIETALSWWASDARLEKRVSYTGLEHIDTALEKGKGIILLTGHFTSMEMGGRLIMLKHPCYVMFRKMNNLLFNAVMFKARTHHSEGIVLRDDPKSMIRALRKNKIVWYAPDQDLGHKTNLFAKFFNVTAASVPATSRLAKISGAAVVPFVPRRDSRGHYTISIGKAFEDFPTGDDVADAQRVNDWLEQEIRQSPEQYLWIHRRFKTQPDENHIIYDDKD